MRRQGYAFYLSLSVGQSVSDTKIYRKFLEGLGFPQKYIRFHVIWIYTLDSWNI